MSGKTTTPSRTAAPRVEIVFTILLWRSFGLAAAIGGGLLSAVREIDQLLPTLVLGVLSLFVVFLGLQRCVVMGIAVGAGKREEA